MLYAFNQWSLVSLLHHLAKGPLLSDLPFSGTIIPKQNWLRPWVNGNWFLRKQVRGLQWSLSPTTVQVEIVESPAFLPCYITIPISTSFLWGVHSYHQLFPQTSYPSLQSTNSTGSFWINHGLIILKGQSKVFCNVSSILQQGSSLLHLIFLTFLNV